MIPATIISRDNYKFYHCQILNLLLGGGLNKELWLLVFFKVVISEPVKVRVDAASVPALGSTVSIRQCSGGVVNAAVAVSLCLQRVVDR